MKLLLLSLLLMLLSCQTKNSEVKENASSEQGEVVKSTGKLDQILGEKQLDNGKLRPHNFDDLYKLKKEDFRGESKLYFTILIDPDHCIVQQRKSYHSARRFTLVIYFNKDQVKKYKVINDFKYVDHLMEKDGFYVLLDNFEEPNQHWKTYNQIRLLKLNKDLDEIWTYQPKSKVYPLQARSVTKEIGRLRLRLHVITGCSICYNIVERIFTPEGECESIETIGRERSDVILKQEELVQIFECK